MVNVGKYTRHGSYEPMGYEDLCPFEDVNIAMEPLLCSRLPDNQYINKPYCFLGVSKNNGTPKSSNLIGFSIILTIHFGGFPPIFGNTQMVIRCVRHVKNMLFGPGFTSDDDH